MNGSPIKTQQLETQWRVSFHQANRRLDKRVHVVSNSRDWMFRSSYFYWIVTGCSAVEELIMFYGYTTTLTSSLSFLRLEATSSGKSSCSLVNTGSADHYNTPPDPYKSNYATRHWQYICVYDVNVSLPSAAYMRRRTGSALVRVIGLSPVRRQAISWTNANLLSIAPSETSIDGIWIQILAFSFKKMRLKMSSAKCWPFCPGNMS